MDQLQSVWSSAWAPSKELACWLWGKAGPHLQAVCPVFWSAAPSSASTLFSPAALTSK